MSPKVSETYKEEKRAAILTGALHCFVEKGFQATTVEDIVRRLGISKGALYGYFASKEEMYIQMANARMDDMVASLSTQFKGLPGAADKIRYLFDRFRKQSLLELRKWVTFHLDFMIYASRNPDLIESHDRYMDKALHVIQDIMEEGRRTGEFRSDLDASSAAYLFWSVRDGLALHFLLGGDEKNYRKILDDMEKMVLRFLASAPV
ncbi:TetR/AcrR family transcriptional regulator [Cohnella pontilimi]|uniref:TetR/AcrR family transcriptional regulator n=1 Tax=Cohnella pontilimi TaxID=2564100 RepID=A0A4U0FET4_9BACL|nr:TetR/AcrR family transcriptional regulator [Cohnella pontilimi]TJY41832.1 TetR/AcrR family transcriptional regulator [Cohnella pontilimi]